MVALLERPGAGEAPRHPPPAQDHCVAAKISHQSPTPQARGIGSCRVGPMGGLGECPRRMLTPEPQAIAAIRDRDSSSVTATRAAQPSTPQPEPRRPLVVAAATDPSVAATTPRPPNPLASDASPSACARQRAPVGPLQAGAATPYQRYSGSSSSWPPFGRSTSRTNPLFSALSSETHRCRLRTL